MTYCKEAARRASVKTQRTVWRSEGPCACVAGEDGRFECEHLFPDVLKLAEEYANAPLHNVPDQGPHVFNPNFGKPLPPVGNPHAHNQYRGPTKPSAEPTKREDTYYDRVHLPATLRNGGNDAQPPEHRFAKSLPLPEPEPATPPKPLEPEGSFTLTGDLK